MIVLKHHKRLDNCDLLKIQSIITKELNKKFLTTFSHNNGFTPFTPYDVVHFCKTFIYDKLLKSQIYYKHITNLTQLEINLLLYHSINYFFCLIDDFIYENSILFICPFAHQDYIYNNREFVSFNLIKSLY